ncbi:hypothetical protein [Sulfuritalea sp.]|uniref:hypothetical protein n=1 Tax=Sulfuritalea sp. TaxID=2480090 RepID=UPI00286E5976|nr:hypothetical protein [Sulfuritalea sp.]
MLDANTVAQLNQLGISAETIESALSGLIVLTVLSVVAAIPTAILAKRKGRSVAGWLILALTIPVVPLLLIWLLPKLPDRPQQ